MNAPLKKKRGIPKKVRGEGDENMKITVPRRSQNASQETELMSDGTPKKKRGRPKKVKSDNIDGNIVPTKIPANSANIESIINDTAMDSERTMFTPVMNKCSDLGRSVEQDLHQKQSQQQQQQTQKQTMNLFPQMPNNNSLNINSGNMQCSMNGNFNQNMQQTSFQSHEHPNSHHPQQTTASNSPQQFSHSDLSSEISAAISTAEHLNAAAGNGETNSPSSNSQSNFESSECVHGDNNWNDHNTFGVSQVKQITNTNLNSMIFL